MSFHLPTYRKQKKRPALVLAADCMDVTVAFITSNLAGQQPHDVVLQPTRGNGIKVASLVRTLKLATLANRLVYGRIGELTATELQQVNAGLKAGLQLP